MNLPNKITISRIIMAIIIVALLIFPFDAVGITTSKLFINESIVIDIKYIIAGILFIIASVTDFVDGYIARKYNLITDYGKMLDAIADKILVDSVLIILASLGFISVIIPVIIVTRDIFVDTIKMIAGNKGNVVAAIYTGKIKTACLMVGTVLTLFYNLPFELLNLRVSDALLVIACVMAIISAGQYYSLNKKFFKEEPKEISKSEKISGDEVLLNIQQMEKTSNLESEEKIEIN